MYIRQTIKDIPILLLHYVDSQWPSDDSVAYLAVISALQTALCEQGHTVVPLCLENDDLPSLLKPYDRDQYLIFNWCEELPGIPHSCAIVAQTLETMGFTFTGADSQALAFSQDKRLVKQRLFSWKIPTPLWQVCRSNEIDGWNCFPAIVKPVFEHSSYGVNRDAVVYTPSELAERVRFVIKTFDQPALVEEFIDGREFHVTVVGNSELDVFPAVEIDFSAFDDVKDHLCSYEYKFDPQSSAYNLIKLRLPALLTHQEQQALDTLAMATYRATNCRDYARMEIRLRDKVFHVLDVNPNADNGPGTCMALAAEAAGLSYGQFGSSIVNLAAQRHPLFTQAKDHCCP